MRKALTTIAVIFLSIGLFFASNIYGYFRFKQYCSSEGGLRVYERLERNVGWLAKDKYEAMETASIENVGFVRYTDQKENKDFDLVVAGKKNMLTLNYEIKPADESRKVIYQLIGPKPSRYQALQPSKNSYQVMRISDNKILVEYNIIHYSFFDSEKMPMSTNQKFSCFNEFDKNKYLSTWVTAINSTF